MSKRMYVRPVIRKQYMGAANKFGGFNIPETMHSIDGISIDSLVEKFGSPLFVFYKTK